MATKEFSFGDQHLSQHAAGVLSFDMAYRSFREVLAGARHKSEIRVDAFTCKFGQRIVDGLRLTQPDSWD